MLPRDEFLIHRKLTSLAVCLAIDGDPSEGYVSLLEGLARVKGLRDAGEPWGEELVSRYHRTLDEFTSLYHITIH